MSTFYFVRHAHADWTPDENRPLSARGRDDADIVTEILGQYPIRAIYSSPFLRARETIMPLARRLDLPVHIEPGLRERRLGNNPSGDFPAAVEATWVDPSFTYPEGESNAVAQRRGMAVLRRLQKQYMSEHIVLSTHGNIMALIMQSVDPSVDIAFWKSLTMPDIYTISFHQDGKAVMSRLWKEARHDVFEDAA
jgi:2,3-bisphosphoglycerate-dependent phosphoglycerate mutase